ncbi:MucB/RseB C-terminal domain-containing protein [Actinomadura fibrosa]|uniref:MucB/RseB C-terminal domain-containing protein n=1 Tax=Actinomadura fibrosa TaxID=111802 RepID=A0ABW2XCA1_9ACTN|nr:MucB/RseB C-terminal domain-containing protein [Actinomadura fibrosa]
MITAAFPGRARRCALVAGGLAGALALAGALSADAGTTRRVRSDPGAVGLLRAAADAARRVPYEGRRFLTTWNRGRSATSEVAVAHMPGEGVTYRSGTGARSYRSDAASGGQDAGFTAATLRLLSRNYAVRRAADASVCGRRARVVEARRADGTAAGRFWIDSETGLMLQRELIDATGRSVVSTGFADIRFATPVQERIVLRAGRSPTKGADGALPEDPAPVSTPAAWEDHLDGGEIAKLRDGGWPVPASLPGRLTLYDARRDGEALHLSYSDGLAAVSVFVQRGRLDEHAMTGWQRSARRGRTVFRRESLHRWAVSSGNGYVYTVLTDVPPSTAEAVAAALPSERTPFWARIGRGARRLASAADPFD